MGYGERIFNLRKSLNLTLEKFGERLGVTKTTISRIEKEERAMTEQMLKAICREFDVSEEWLRTGEGEMYIEIDKENLLMMWAADVLKDESDSFKRRFVKMLSQLEESDWKVLERMAIMLHSENEEN